MAPTNLEPFRSLEELQVTIALPDGVTEHQLLRFLLRSVDAIMDQFTVGSKYVPTDALPSPWLITANAIGDPQISVSSTSTTPPGHSSPTSPSAEESSTSPFDPSIYPVPEEETLFRIQQPSEKHQFEGFVDRNCIHCNMPYNANQHYRMFIQAGIVVQHYRDT